MSNVGQDVRYALRTLGRNPAFTAVALLTLALGIGVNTAIFTLIDATLFAPTPGAEPDRLMSIFSSRPDDAYALSSYPDYADLRDSLDAFESLGAYSTITVTWNSGERTETLSGMIATGNYFSTLGVRPAAGRFFLPIEDRTPGTHAVAVVSHRFWVERLGGRRDLAAVPLILNGRPFTLVGVAPAGFAGLNLNEDADVWIPAMMQHVVRPPRAGFYGGMDPDLLGARGARWMWMFGRLAPEASPEEAQSAIEVVGARLRRDHPRTNDDVRFTLVPAEEGDPETRADLVPAAFLMLAVVGLVLLIACANVANLLLARTAARRNEVATRIALGASRGRLIRQFLTESVVLSLAGGAAGLMLAVWTTSLFAVRIAQTNVLPVRLPEIAPNPTILAFTLLVSLATAGIFGLVPAIEAGRANLTAPTRASIGGRSRLRSGLVISQVAVSALLLVGTGLFLESLRNASRTDPGFEIDKLLLAPIEINLLSYSREQGRDFYRRVVEEVEALPGVESAGLARVVTLAGGGRRIEIGVDGREPDDEPPIVVGANVVSEGYFRTMDVQLVAGRTFDGRDGPNAERVAIVNEELASRYWPDGDVLGRPIWVDRDSEAATIVGVAKTGKYVSIGEDPRPFVYLPLGQNHESGVTLHVRTEADPAALVGPLQSVLRGLEPNLPAAALHTMSEQIARGLFPARVGASMIALFGLLALTLAAIGIYGVISYSVAQRTREFGVRIALGARGADVVGMVLGQTFRIVVLGIGIGLAASLATTQFVEGFLYGVSGRDPSAFLAGAIVLFAVALAAGFVPAWRATRIDPVTALRLE